MYNAADVVAALPRGGLPGFPGGLQILGPGLRQIDVPRVLIFDAGTAGRDIDPLARFYDEDLPTLDWLRDYLVTEDLPAVPNDDVPRFGVNEADDEDEAMYSKIVTAQIESDGAWADS
jgi:hypothetical protein